MSDDEGFSLVLSLDGQSSDYLLGFEAGRVWEQLKGDYPFEQTFHAANMEIVMRMREQTGRPMQVEDSEDDAYQLGHTDGGVLIRKLYGHPSESLARQRLKAGLGRKVVPIRSLEDADREQVGRIDWESRVHRTMIERRQHGQAYAHDETAYWARCWYCDWTGPRRSPTREGKSECKRDYALHDFAEERDVGPWERVPS